MKNSKTELKTLMLLASPHSSNNMQISTIDPAAPVVSEEELTKISDELFELN